MALALFHSGLAIVEIIFHSGENVFALLQV